MKIADLYCISVRLAALRAERVPGFTQGYRKAQIVVTRDTSGTLAIYPPANPFSVINVFVPNRTFADYDGVPWNKCATMYTNRRDAERVCETTNLTIKGHAKVVKYETGICTDKPKKRVRRSKGKLLYQGRSLEPTL